MKKYLILGGAGFIGSHISERLLHQGNKVVIVDNLPAKMRNASLMRYEINIEDAKKIAAVFKKEKPDFVFHLAGPINLRKAIGSPLFLKDINFLSRIHIVLDACKKHKAKKLIFVSSGGAIYEGAAAVPTGEEYPVSPNSLYGLANLMTEKYIELYCKNYHMDFTIPRFSNVYGPRQWQSGVIPSFITKISKKESPIIFGTGSQTRDFIYIDDAIEALLVLAKKGENTIYNVGSGKEISLKRTLALVNGLLGASIKPTYQVPRSFEVPRSALDISKIQKEFAWRPKTNIKEGLLKTIEYYTKGYGTYYNFYLAERTRARLKARGVKRTRRVRNISEATQKIARMRPPKGKPKND